MPRLEEGLLDTLAKTRLLEQKNEGIESLIVTLLAIELKFMDLQSTFQLIKLICENSR
jgi:hypothetical protein